METQVGWNGDRKVSIMGLNQSLTKMMCKLREAERKQRLCQKHSRCRESNGYFFTAETNSIMGRRISSFIPSMSIISFGGCGSTMC